MALPSFPVGGGVMKVALSSVQGHFCKPPLQCGNQQLVHYNAAMHCSTAWETPAQCGEHNSAPPILVHFVTREVFARQPQVRDPSLPPTGSPVFINLASVQCPQSPDSIVKYPISNVHSFHGLMSNVSRFVQPILQSYPFVSHSLFLNL